MTRFCVKCQSVMRRVPHADHLVMECIACHHSEPAADDDANIGGGAVKHDNVADSIAMFLRRAPFDPVNLKVARACEKCGLPYITVVRFGPSETIITICKCEVDTLL